MRMNMQTPFKPVSNLKPSSVSSPFVDRGAAPQVYSLLLYNNCFFNVLRANNCDRMVDLVDGQHTGMRRHSVKKKTTTKKLFFFIKLNTY